MRSLPRQSCGLSLFNFAEKSAARGELVAFDEEIDIVRPHTTPPHDWRALTRALEAFSRLAEDPPPVCGFKMMLAMREGLQCTASEFMQHFMKYFTSSFPWNISPHIPRQLTR